MSSMDHGQPSTNEMFQLKHRCKAPAKRVGGKGRRQRRATFSQLVLGIGNFPGLLWEKHRLSVQQERANADISAREAVLLLDGPSAERNLLPSGSLLAMGVLLPVIRLVASATHVSIVEEALVERWHPLETCRSC